MIHPSENTEDDRRYESVFQKISMLKFVVDFVRHILCLLYFTLIGIIYLKVYFTEICSRFIKKFLNEENYSF